MVYNAAAHGCQSRLGGPLFYIAKLLQVLGLFVLLDGLYVGVRYQDMQTELLLLLGGMLVFFVGHRLDPSRSR